MNGPLLLIWIVVAINCATVGNVIYTMREMTKKLDRLEAGLIRHIKEVHNG